MKTLKTLIVMLVLGMFLAQTAVYADWNPKGWFKGKKKGWNGEQTPPGLTKKEVDAANKKAAKEAKKMEKEAAKQAKKAEKAAGETASSTAVPTV